VAALLATGCVGAHAKETQVSNSDLKTCEQNGSCTHGKTQAQFDSDLRTCEQVASSLNKRWLDAKDRFDPDSGPLNDWLANHGIMVSMCVPSGYPNVTVPCTDDWTKDYYAASWVGLTDTLEKKIEADESPDLPLFLMDAVGVVYDFTSPQTEVRCAYPTDGASVSRDDKGCGAIKSDFHLGSDPPSIWGSADYPQPSLREAVAIANNKDASFEDTLLLENFIRDYEIQVEAWDPADWQNVRTWENYTCNDAVNKGDPMFESVTAFGPKDPSLDACLNYVKNGSNIFDKDIGMVGSNSVWQSTGSWDDPAEAVLGHPMCVDDSPKCTSEGNCETKYHDIFWEYVGGCSWQPDQFQSMIDAWDAIRERQVDPKATLWNEIVMSLESGSPGKEPGTPGGVEALFVINTDYGFGDGVTKDEIQGMHPGIGPNVTDYWYYAAKQMADEYYHVPLVALTPTKERALNGTMFSCDFTQDGSS